MLKIGYVRLRDAGSADDTAALKAAGCHVVRAEEPVAPGADDSAVLSSILDFIGEGDELVVTRVQHLGHSAAAILDIVARLDARGAALAVLSPQINSRGECGRALRSVLEALAAIGPAGPPVRRRAAPVADEIKALQKAGVGPVEIARRLGVSRMTVWRKLRTVDVD